MKERIRELFQIDLRSLALFRMGLACVILADLIKRCLSLGAHYTDHGVLPRQAILQHVKGFHFSPFHMLGGEH